MFIDILGTKWKVQYKEEKNDKALESSDGYCDNSVKLIAIRIMERDDNSLKDLESYSKKVLRHEITHAFLHESGLSINSGYASSWATNEEMVDWIAIQGPKIYKAWEQAKAL